jgi:hypothetical protein
MPAPSEHIAGKGGITPRLQIENPWATLPDHSRSTSFAARQLREARITTAICRLYGVDPEGLLRVPAPAESTLPADL